MVYDTLAHAPLYYPLGQRIEKGLQFLAQADFAALPDGRLEIDGPAVYANISRGRTLAENLRAEAHRAYLDLQYLIEGQEQIAVAPKDSLRQAEAQPEQDVWFYTGVLEPLTLTPGRFLLLWPQDAHAPGIAPGGVPEAVRKCVVKILL